MVAILMGSKSPWYISTMNPNILSSVAQLCNQELVAQVKHFAGRERAAMVSPA